MKKTIVGTLDRAVGTAAVRADQCGDFAPLDAVEERVANAQEHNDVLRRKATDPDEATEAQARDDALRGLREKVRAARAAITRRILADAVGLTFASAPPRRL